jgi:hypothetical protein
MTVHTTYWVMTLTLFGIRNNCLGTERSLFLYLYIRRVIKLIVVIIMAYYSDFIHYFIQYPSQG